MKAFDWMLRKRGQALVFLLVLTSVLAFFITKLKVDFSIEYVFPRFDQSRVDYERYRRDFPFDDAQAIVIVEAPDLFTPPGLRRVAALETDLGKLPGVIDTQGLTTVQDLVGDADSVRLERLFPSPDLSADALAARRVVATTDPMFRWNLAPPDGHATSIRVTLDTTAASKEELRTEFLKAARAVLATHDAAALSAGVSQKLTLSGLPVIRSKFTEMVGRDLATLFPLAFVVILALLYLTFRTFAEIGAAVLTIYVSVLWVMGFMGLVGVPVQVLTQTAPILVMIVSISDTVHIVSHVRDEAARGLSVREAILHSLHENAIPCLLTEITIAAGLLSIALNDMVMIQQFGLITAVGMMLTWLANMTVLPLALSFWYRRPPVVAARASFAARWFARFITWTERMITERPGRVVAVFASVLLVAAAMATRVGKEYFAYDDLRPDSPLKTELRYADGVVGGTVPIAIVVEPTDPAQRVPDAMLSPAALSLLDRITQKLEIEHGDDVKSAMSLSKVMRKAHRLLAGDDAASESPLPSTQRLAAQELLAFDDPRMLRDIVSTDRSSAAVFALAPDSGSTHATGVIRDLRLWLDDEGRRTGYTITLTGIYGITDGIYRSMVGGLVASLAVAVATSLFVFWAVLRSLRLAAIALVPNLAPLVVTLGIMSALRIDVKPSTVVIFSVTLVIADDDTIQYMVRFRDRCIALTREGHPDPHREAALSVLRAAGLPMFVTATAVSIGFLTLTASQFLGLSHTGLLIGVSLFAAVFADLFLTPIMLIKLKPRIA